MSKLFVVDCEGVTLGRMVLVRALDHEDAKQKIRESGRFKLTYPEPDTVALAIPGTKRHLGVREVTFKDSMYVIWDGDY